MARTLTTIDGVINILGGIAAVADMTGRGETAVHNWRKADRFPASLYLKMIRRLERRGVTAKAALWGQESDRVAA
jgi:hypothetical protein